MRLRHRSWSNRVVEENDDIGLRLADIEEDSLKSFDRLEIGSGLGGFLLGCSALHPESRILGVEVAYNAFATALKKLSPHKATQKNFLLVNAPIERLLPYLCCEQFEAIYINFPDPWPKKRQQHRRLSSIPLLHEYYRLLKKGGQVFFRTDNVGLYEDSKEYFRQSDLFKVETISPFYSEKVDFLPPTEYERKFREKGVDIHLIVATKA